MLSEIECQLTDKNHPVQSLLTVFKQRYRQEYYHFFVKTEGLTNTQLASQIEVENQRIRKTFPEDQINFSDDVVGEAKKFIVVAFLTTLKFYEPCFDGAELDWAYYKMKLTSIVVRLTLEGATLKIVQAMCKYDTLQEEKAYKKKCKMAKKGLKLADLGVSAML